MAMTRDEFVTEICDVVGKNVSASAVSGKLLQERVVMYLNFAQVRIVKHHSFYCLQDETDVKTVTDVWKYPLTTGTNNFGLTRVANIHGVILNHENWSRKLLFWHYRKFDRWYPRPENYTTGKPYIYSRWGNRLLFFRIPNDVYDLKIKYGKYARPLTSGSQVSDLGEENDRLLLTAGILETYLALQEYTDTRIWFELFLGQLKDAVRAEDDPDWEPEGEPHDKFPKAGSGEPWSDPFGTVGDPLFDYIA